MSTDSTKTGPGPQLAGADGSAIGTVLGEAQFVCDGCGEWKQSGEMHRDSDGRKILCIDCELKKSPNAQRERPAEDGR